MSSGQWLPISLKEKNMRPRSSFGFTFIETIIVIALLSLLGAFTLHFLVDSVQLYTLAVKQKALFDEARIALEKICRDLRDAQSISSPAAGSSGNTLSFVRSHATAGDGAYENITFRQRGTILEKVKSTPAVIIPLAENVTNFSVTRALSTEEIQILLTLSRSSGERVTMQTKVQPRNLAVHPLFKNFFGHWQER